MKEIIRQFVLFGNFNNVTFESILKLGALKEKYGLQVNAMPDIQLPVPGQPIQFTTVAPESRPVLQTADKQTVIFFGTKRIHIEQKDTISDTYESYNKQVIDIVGEVIKVLDVKINRVAINGQLFNDDEKSMATVYNSLFKASKLYGSNSDEWQLRVCSKEKIDSLGCDINRIVQFVRGDFIDNRGVNQKGLIASYDYNTQVNIEKIFTFSEIQIFNKLAQEYRKLFIF